MPNSSLHDRRATLLLWVFVLSGFSGLIYQSIWTQYLGLFLGHSSYAQSLVLILFMGGMAAGAWIASRRTESFRRPLMAYVVIELIIGVLGLTFHWAYSTGTFFAYEQLFPALGSIGSITTARWVLSTAFILPACVLLGATFPLMSAGLLRLHPESGGRVLAGLYFTNSIGAVAGALTATYFLLPNVGLPGAIMTAGLLNIFVAMLVYPAAKESLPSSRPDPAKPSGGNSGSKLILVVAAATGATSFIYEIVWIRMLSLAVGTTLHAFELMLAAFISGIAFGGLWLRNRADRLRSPIAAAGWAQILMGIAALLSLLLYANAFEWVGWIMRALNRSEDGYVAYNVSTALISLAIMFPAAFFAGMTLPLLTLSLLRNKQGERSVGAAYAANTFGAILGVLAALHVLMPLIGVKWAIWLAAAIDLALGLALLSRSLTLPDRQLSNPLIPGVALVSIIFLAGFAFVRFDPLTLASSVYRTGTTALRGDADMLYYKDGKTASVAVFETGPEDFRIFSIATNGKVDAGLAKQRASSPRPDEYTMALLAALPLAIKEDVGEVGVIGFGSGMTTHFVLGSSRVERVDTVEIEPAMVEGALHFRERVPRAFDDPRSNIIIDDAKAHFSSSNNKYDVIISEPSNPWVGGTATLFTEEFYRFIPRHLSDDGLFVQWLQLYEIDLPLVSSVLRAMLPHFSDVNAYVANDGDLILIASVSGKVPDVLDNLAFDEDFLSELKRLGVESPRDLQDAFAMDAAALRGVASLADVPANSDYFPYLQLAAPGRRFIRARVSLFGDTLAAPWPLASTLGHFQLRRVDEPLPAVTRDISVDRKLRAAREIRDAMITGNSISALFTTRSDAIQMYALRGLGQSCSLDSSPVQSSLMILSLAMETVAFLRPEDSRGLWISPSWLACEPLDQMTVNTLRFVDATSSRSNVDVLSAGSALMDGPGAEAIFRDPSASYYVKGAMQLAALQLEDPEAAAALIEKYDHKLLDGVREQPMIRLLNYLSTRGR